MTKPPGVFAGGSVILTSTPTAAARSAPRGSAIDLEKDVTRVNAKKKFGHKFRGIVRAAAYSYQRNRQHGACCVSGRERYLVTYRQLLLGPRGLRVSLGEGDGAKELRTHKDNIGRWLTSLRTTASWSCCAALI